MAVTEGVPGWWRWWYFGWQLAAFVGLLALLLTFTLGNVKRPRILSSLLLFSRHLSPDPPPNFALCVTQASLLMPSVAAQEVAVLGLTSYILRLELHLLQTVPPEWKLGDRGRRAVAAIELGAPWLVWLILSLVNLEWGLRNRAAVVRGPFYCSLDNDTLSVVNSLAAVLPSLAAIGNIAVTGLLLLRSRWSFSRRRLCAAASDVEFSLVLRVLPFGVWLVIGVVVVSVHAANSLAPVSNLVMTIDGASVFILLLQEDILLAWGIPPHWIPLSSSGSTVSGVSVQHANDDDELNSSSSGSPRERTSSSASQIHLHPILCDQTAMRTTDHGRVEIVELPALAGERHPDLLTPPDALKISRPMPLYYPTPTSSPILTFSDPVVPARRIVIAEPDARPGSRASGESVYTIRSSTFAKFWKRGKDRGDGGDGRKSQWIGSRGWSMLTASREERRIRKAAERREARERSFLTFV